MSIKFPDREPQQLRSQPSEEGEESAPPPADDPARNLILITGRKENCEAAKLALMVRLTCFL